MLSGVPPRIGDPAVCASATPGAVQRGFRLAGGAWLLSIGCDARSYWYMLSIVGDTPEPLILPEPLTGDMDAGRTGLENAIFDFDSGTLRAARLVGAAGDCGTTWAWGWSAEGWILLERRETPACEGRPSADWIATYRRAAFVERERHILDDSGPGIVPDR